MSFQLKHPALGVLATVLMVVLSLLISVSLAPTTMIAWVTLLLVAMVPPQIVLTLALQGKHPASLARLPQPLRGVAFCALTALIGLPIAAGANLTLGGGLTPPTPFANMFLILGVCVTLGIVAQFQCWPFSVLFPKKPLLMGLAILVGAYAFTTLLFKFLFNFDFLQGAPFYRAELNPHGLFMAWIPLIFALTSFVVILCLILLDFWPVSKLPPLFAPLGKQPWFGIVASLFITLVASCIWALFVGNLQMDMVVFMVRVIISTIFGIFILLIMMEGAQFVNLPQPARGGVLIMIAAFLSMASFALYRFACQHAFGLASGPPSYDRELWLASAMLAVTFPVMVAYANFFQFWPFRRAAAEAQGEA